MHLRCGSMAQAPVQCTFGAVSSSSRGLQLDYLITRLFDHSAVGGVWSVRSVGKDISDSNRVRSVHSVLHEHGIMTGKGRLPPLAATSDRWNSNFPRKCENAKRCFVFFVIIWKVLKSSGGTGGICLYILATIKYTAACNFLLSPSFLKKYAPNPPKHPSKKDTLFKKAYKNAKNTPSFHPSK